METANLLPTEPTLLIESHELPCLICNSGTSIQNSYSIFYTVLPNKGTLLCNSIQKVIKRAIDPDVIRSTVLCSRCFSLFDELEVCEDRCFQLRQNIISWFNTSCQIYGDVNSFVTDGVACQTDPITSDIVDIPVQTLPNPPPGCNPIPPSRSTEVAVYESFNVENSNSSILSNNDASSPKEYGNEEFVEDPKNVKQSEMIVPVTKEAMRRLRRYRHQCHHCNRMFRRPSELKKHVATHTDSKPFTCGKCHRKFASKQGIIIHLSRTHNIEASEDSSAIEALSDSQRDESGKNPEDFVLAVIGENSIATKSLNANEFDGNDDSSDLLNSTADDYDGDFEWEEGFSAKASEPQLELEPAPNHLSESDPEYQPPAIRSEKRGRKPKSKTPSDEKATGGEGSTEENNEEGDKKDKTKRIRKRGNRTSERYTMPAIHECDQCGKKWRTISELKSHIASHSSLRPYVCEICGQAYKMRKALDVHVGMHNGIHPYTCHICNKSFTQKVGLQKHLPIHTGYTRFQCDLCGKRFIHHKSFNIHKMTHTGEKTIKCSICGLAVLSQSHLKRHYRVHTGERPYACEICGKRFAEKYNLNAHGRVHDPESSVDSSRKKVHRCQLCGVCYDRKHKLEDHLATAHNKLSDDRPASTVVLSDLQALNYFNRAFTS
nr:PREDICTED: zinc finger protein with KRAB and SCAN domains 7-like [Bemisia tabaci]